MIELDPNAVAFVAYASPAPANDPESVGEVVLLSAQSFGVVDVRPPWRRVCVASRMRVASGSQATNAPSGQVRLTVYADDVRDVAALQDTGGFSVAVVYDTVDGLVVWTLRDARLAGWSYEIPPDPDAVQLDFVGRLVRETGGL